MTLPSDYYEQEGLLTAAMRASNPAAVKLLLKHGASPHAYQNLFLTSYPEPRFLYPLQTIAQDDRMDLSEKQALTKAFLDAGAVVPDPAPINPSGKAIPIEEAQQIQTKTASALGMKLPPSPLCCKTPGPICKEASQRTGEDWCSIVAKMPTRLNVDFSKKPDDGPIWDVELRYLLGVSGNKAYFMGLRDLHSSYTSVAYVLIEVSKDASSWTVLSFMAPQAGMGICKKDEPGDTGEPPEYCWRRIPIHRIAGTDQMRFDQWDLTWNIQK
jgi:ankyrin repeat protein